MTCYEAAENGNLEILQWAIDRGCPEPINNEAYDEFKNNLFGM